MKVAVATNHMVEPFRRAFPDLYVVENEDNLSPDTDLLIFTGGSDVSPSRYQQHYNGAYGVDHDRDEKEFRIIHEATRKYSDMKVFGVCRGLQLMNVYYGGTLIQDLGDVGKEHGGAHQVKYESERHPFAFLSYVNSLHHQAIAGIGKLGFHNAHVISTEPETGIIEAISWSPNSFAVQYHPEFFGDELYDKFFDLIKKWGQGKMSLSNPRDKQEKKSYQYVSSNWATIQTDPVTIPFQTWDAPNIQQMEEELAELLQPTTLDELEENDE